MPGSDLVSEVELTHLLEQGPPGYRPAVEVAQLLLRLARARVPDEEVLRVLNAISRGDNRATAELHELDPVRECAEVAEFLDPKTDEWTKAKKGLEWRRKHQRGLVREAEQAVSATFSFVEAQEMVKETLDRFFEPAALERYLREGSPMIQPVDVIDADAIGRWFEEGSPLAQGLHARSGLLSGGGGPPAVMDVSRLNQLIRDPNPWPESWLAPLLKDKDTVAATKRVLALAGRSGDVRAERHRARRLLLVAVLNGALSSRLGFSPVLGLPFVYRDRALRHDLRDALKTYWGRRAAGTLVAEPESGEYPAIRSEDFSDPGGLIEVLVRSPHPAARIWREALERVDPSLVPDFLGNGGGRRILAPRLAAAFGNLLNGVDGVLVLSPLAARDSDLSAELRRFLWVAGSVFGDLNKDPDRRRLYHRKLLELSFPHLIHGPPPLADWEVTHDWEVEGDNLDDGGDEGAEPATKQSSAAAPGVDAAIPEHLHDATNRAVLDLLLKTSISPDWHGEATRLAVIHRFDKRDAEARKAAQALIYEIFHQEHRAMARAWSELQDQCRDLEDDLARLRAEEQSARSVISGADPAEARDTVIATLEAISDRNTLDSLRAVDDWETPQWVQVLIDRVREETVETIGKVRSLWIDRDVRKHRMLLLDYALTRKRLDLQERRMMVKEKRRGDLAQHAGIWVRSQQEVADLLELNQPWISKRLQKPRRGLPPLMSLATDFVRARQKRVAFPNDDQDPLDSARAPRKASK